MFDMDMDEIAMNVFTIVILTALIGQFILDLWSNVLNLRSLRKQPPDGLQDLYDKEAYRKSQEMTYIRTRFGLIRSAFFLAVLLVFWYLGGFNRLDMLVGSLEFGPVFSGLAYIGALLAAQALFNIPFSWYSTFVIEEKFGFNKTTPALFIADLLKTVVLTIVIGGPILAGILALFEYGGAAAWLWCWFGIVSVKIGLQYIMPTWLLPLFNKYTPLEEGRLRTAIMEYAVKVQFPLKDIFIVDGSKRSSRANAYFTGFGRNKMIAIYDTLAERYSIPELVSVIAHEVGHYKNRHLLKNLLLSTAHTGILLYLVSIFICDQHLYAAFQMDHMSIHAGFVFFSLLFTPVESVFSALLNYLSRRYEFEADRFTVETLGSANRLEPALKTLARENLSNLTPHPLFVFLNYSHPPIWQRLQALHAAANGGSADD